jgi:hypothetical protein
MKVCCIDQSLCSFTDLSVRQIAYFLQTIMPAKLTLSLSLSLSLLVSIRALLSLPLCPRGSDLNSIAGRARTTLTAPSNRSANFPAAKQSANWLDKAARRRKGKPTKDALSSPSGHQSIHWHTHKIGNKLDVAEGSSAAYVMINNNNNNHAV